MLQGMTDSPHSLRIASEGKRITRSEGFTLVDVMIGSILTVICIFGLYNLMRVSLKVAAENAYRLEAYRLAQGVSEHAMAVSLTNFTPSGLTGSSDVTGAGSTNTAWNWSSTEKAMTQSQLSTMSLYSSPLTQYTSKDGKVVFTKTITDNSSSTYTFTGKASLLFINVTWTFNNKNFSITLPVVRGT